MRVKRTRRGDAEVKDISLNLLPFMNLMTLLIPFLLLSASFITIAVIDSSLPAIGAPQPKDKADEEDKDPPLNLQIAITDEGFSVSGSAEILGCPKAGDAAGASSCKKIPLRESRDYCQQTQCGGVTAGECRADPACHDFEELRALVTKLKNPRWEGAAMMTAYPEEGNVILAPNASIKYSVLVGVMDATRDVPECEAGKTTGCFPSGGTLNPVGAGQVKESASECYPNVCLFPYVVIAGGAK